MKPRLRLVAYGSYLIALAVMFLTVGVVLSAIWAMGDDRGSGIWTVVLYIGLPVVASYLTMFVLKVLLVRLGFMTQQEARAFPLRRSRWPDSWLEPLDEAESGRMEH